MVKRILALGAFCLLARCATAPPERVNTAAPIRAAEEMGAAKVPEAALELKLAREQTAQAEQLMRNGDKDHRANMLLRRAQADAELALVLAKEAPLVAEAKSASEEVKALQQRNQQSNQ